jgi:hypothetical protein
MAACFQNSASFKKEPLEQPAFSREIKTKKLTNEEKFHSDHLRNKQ